MTKDQVTSFLSGLLDVERQFPHYFVQYGELKHCVFIYQHEENQQIDIKPLCSIEENSLLWKRIQRLFYRVLREYPASGA